MHWIIRCFLMQNSDAVKHLHQKRCQFSDILDRREARVTTGPFFSLPLSFPICSPYVKSLRLACLTEGQKILLNQISLHLWNEVFLPHPPNLRTQAKVDQKFTDLSKHRWKPCCAVYILSFSAVLNSCFGAEEYRNSNERNFFQV